MARDEKKPAVVPLANIAVLAAFVGGLAMYLSPLTSARPSVEAAHNGDGWGDQDVDARLWQDPLEVASKHEDEVISQAGNAGRFDPAEESARSVEAVSYRLAGAEGAPYGRCRPSAGASRILAVMVRGGPYEEAVEGRLRVRRAVVEGLSASGFAPEDYQHVGYLRLEQWPPSDPGETVQQYQLCGGVDDAETATVPGHELLVPFEWYDRAAASSTTSRAGTSPAPSHILVLWLRDDAFQPNPLSRLAWLLSQLRTSPTKCAERPLVNVSVIGPSTSNGLGAMLREKTNRYTAEKLEGVEMLSAFASASERALLEQAGINDAEWHQRSLRAGPQALPLHAPPDDPHRRPGDDRAGGRAAAAAGVGARDQGPHRRPGRARFHVRPLAAADVHRCAAAFAGGNARAGRRARRRVGRDLLLPAGHRREGSDRSQEREERTGHLRSASGDPSARGDGGHGPIRLSPQTGRAPAARGP